jgi:hypothetical protein
MTHLCAVVMPCTHTQSPEPPAASGSSAQQLDAGVRRLGLQGGEAGSNSGNSSSSQLAAAAAAATAAADAGVSQSRASSQIRVKKFHKLLDEQLVRSRSVSGNAWHPCIPAHTLHTSCARPCHTVWVAAAPAVLTPVQPPRCLGLHTG